MVCDVCINVFSFDLDTTSDENAIVQCVQCHVNVHQFCYGVVEYSDNWLCNFCEKNDAGKEKICELCPNKMGAVKPTICKKWVHTICALFTPQVVIKNTKTTMSPINISKVPKKSYGLHCYLCDENGTEKINGASVNCSYPRCKRNLHITCAQLAGTLKEKNNGDRLSFIVYCKDHVDISAPRISISSIDKVLESRKKINNQETAKKANSKWIVSAKIPVSIKDSKAVTILKANCSHNYCSIIFV